MQLEPHPPHPQAHETLRSVFGFSDFRPHQQPIVESILARQDVFVLMPTGAGKSLCYQLPALLLDGVTVVVSPLIALMKDQVDALRARGIAAAFINSSLTSAEVGRLQGAVARGDIRILYVAPERLLSPSFLQLLSAVNVAQFAIDEAHCISEWGHDFRPEYRGLSRLRAQLPNTPIGAFTATATPRVQADVILQLGLDEPSIFRGSFDRPNLFYEVHPKRKAFPELLGVLWECGDVAGIVYCLSRATTEEVASGLIARGFRAAAYHAGLTADDRRARQDAFAAGDVRIIVATIAFGMGIDKSDVRFVIHYDLPKNLEGLYQETGRAGRDGQPSRCVLLYSYADAAKHEYFIGQKTSAAEQRVAHEQLSAVKEWADTAACRRRKLLAYFDETVVADHDPCCDNCREPRRLVDRTIDAQKFLSCVRRTGERFGATHIVDVLRGSGAERIRRFGHDRLSTFGIGRDRSREEWTQIAHQLVAEGHLRRAADEFNALRLTQEGEAVLFAGKQVFLPVERPPGSVAPGEPEQHQPGTGLTERSGIAATADRTVQLLREGLSVEEIAERRKLATRTIEGHIAEALENGADIDIDRLVPPERQTLIASAIADVGADLLKPIFERLGGACSYGEISFMRAAMRAPVADRNTTPPS